MLSHRNLREQANAQAAQSVSGRSAKQEFGHLIHHHVFKGDSRPALGVWPPGWHA
ncbi:hypothetical protein ACVDG8_015370 [Mesorhizobium sp. ORM8.1]